MRILIAEDDEALGKFVRQGLEDEHYTVDVFKDGRVSKIASSASTPGRTIIWLSPFPSPNSRLASGR